MSVKNDKWPGKGEATERCPDCHGSGAAPGELARSAESRVTAIGGSFGSTVRQCSRCQGRGRVLAATVLCGHGFRPNECALCGGSQRDLEGE